MSDLFSDNQQLHELIMQCPHCNQHFVDVSAWKRFLPGDYYDQFAPDKNTLRGSSHVNDRDANQEFLAFEWAFCPNEDCKRLIVKGISMPRHSFVAREVERKREEWIIVPRKAKRYINPLIPRQYAGDYQEASAILDDSPKMSAKLSIKILADLLKDYAKCTHRHLHDQIAAFAKNSQYPEELKEHLHYCREIANFGSHTQQNQLTDEIIEVGRDDAEWVLDVIDELFEYFILRPNRNKAMRAKWDARIMAE